jgi:DNA polymerase-1
MTFRLSPTMAEAIAEVPATPDKWVIRRSAAVLAGEKHVFQTPAEAQGFVEHLYRLPVGAIAIDTEYRFRTPCVPLRGGGTWQDPSALDPLILSGAAWVPDEGRAIGFMFDLRLPGMAAVVEHLLRLRTLFVAHNIKAEFQTFWSLDLDPILPQTHDTYVAARCLLLGTGHPSIELKRRTQEEEDWNGLETANTQISSLLSLAGQCEAYGIPHPYAGSKVHLQASFLEHPENAPFSKTQIDYAMADAELTLQLYLAQQPDILKAGLHAHLHQVEFPYAEANARMEFDGVPLDQQKLVDLAEGLHCAVDREVRLLRSFGIDNPASTKQVIDFLVNRGWRDRITVKGKLTSEDKVLEQIAALDPAVPHIRAFRRYRALLGGQFLTGELIGLDGRFHPNHRHLGAETGRNTCSAPNVVGLARHFRPVVTAPPGRAVVEADYAQIEVGIAAAEAGDVELIEAFNSGDVYAAVARAFYWSDLSLEEQRMELSEFKRRRRDLRDRIKVFVLATLYNMQDQSVADRFAISLAEAKQQRTAFLEKYLAVREMMGRVEIDGRIRGYAPIIGGLRRHVATGRGSANKHINTPVQAGAGVVFRRAVADLYQHYRGTNTRLILPVHDAVVVECDVNDITQVSAGLGHIMSQAVRSYYPALRPRIDVNNRDPSCWNKDGQSDALENFIGEARSDVPTN